MNQDLRSPPRYAAVVARTNRITRQQQSSSDLQVVISDHQVRAVACHGVASQTRSTTRSVISECSEHHRPHQITIPTPGICSWLPGTFRAGSSRAESWLRATFATSSDEQPLMTVQNCSSPSDVSEEPLAFVSAKRSVGMCGCCWESPEEHGSQNTERIAEGHHSHARLSVGACFAQYVVDQWVIPPFES